MEKFKQKDWEPVTNSNRIRTDKMDVPVEEYRKEQGNITEELRNIYFFADDLRNKAKLPLMLMRGLNEKDIAQKLYNEVADNVDKLEDYIKSGKGGAEETQELYELKQERSILENKLSKASQNIHNLVMEDENLSAKYRDFIIKRSENENLSKPINPRWN
jgi:hypothetical protein